MISDFLKNLVNILLASIFNDINIISDSDECSTGLYCIGLGQTCVNYIGGYNCACLPGYKQMDTVVTSQSSEVVTISQATMNTLNTNNYIQPNVTNSIATIYTTNIPNTSPVLLPFNCIGNFM